METDFCEKYRNFTIYSTEQHKYEDEKYPRGATYCNDFDGLIEIINLFEREFGRDTIRVIRNRDHKYLSVDYILSLAEQIEEIKQSIF